MDKWKEVREGFDQWLKITCYLGFVWVGFKVLQFLPADIANRVIEAFLEYIGI
jgi:heme/copper-type cytochrome/quinol oxidase subunit 3